MLRIVPGVVYAAALFGGLAAGIASLPHLRPFTRTLGFDPTTDFVTTVGLTTTLVLLLANRVLDHWRGEHPGWREHLEESLWLYVLAVGAAVSAYETGGADPKAVAPLFALAWAISLNAAWHALRRRASYSYRSATMGSTRDARRAGM